MIVSKTINVCMYVYFIYNQLFPFIFFIYFYLPDKSKQQKFTYRTCFELHLYKLICVLTYTLSCIHFFAVRTFTVQCIYFRLHTALLLISHYLFNLSPPFSLFHLRGRVLLWSPNWPQTGNLPALPLEYQRYTDISYVPLTPLK